MATVPAENRAMSLAEAERLVALSRETYWDYPTSYGRPVKWDEKQDWVDRLVSAQASFPDAARLLIENNHEEFAVSMAANVWRLWMLSRDMQGGREFLAIVLNGRIRTPSRARALALYGDGLFLHRQGKIDESLEKNEESFKIGRQINEVHTSCPRTTERTPVGLCLRCR